ncbi:hypothetical protein CEP54_014101 [Fusarium duplospermum]|uniref:Uncharacterized protein n=1 Tax=Fusarium duplospermum TaxID=1325734 RepID=A0A428NYE5_9HYPO|nr:hypothetical protein CEP54_014101 [Fusarium duplospermum]
MEASTKRKSQLGPEDETLVIFNNDLPDSDNWAAALVQALNASRTNTRVVFILESRQVSLASYMTAKDQRALLKVIQKSSGKCIFDARKVMLNGFSGDYHGHTRDWDLELLSDEERNLLRKVERPAYDPKPDAILHAELVTLDFASYLVKHSFGRSYKGTGEICRSNIEILIDSDSLPKIKNPVNLNAHHRDEIFGRNHPELQSFEKAATMEGEERKEAFRNYYRESIHRKTKELGDSVKVLVKGSMKGSAEDSAKHSAIPIGHLDRTNLYERIEAAKSVHWFGGCSLTLLQDVHRAGLAAKLNCCVQAVSARLIDMYEESKLMNDEGTFDLSDNLFPEQFNICLNRDAADYVFEHHADFADFLVVPTNSAQAVQYSMRGILNLDEKDLGQRILGFNFYKDPIEIRRQPVILREEYNDKRVVMPDLTALLGMVAPSSLGGEARNVKVKRSKNKEEPLLFELSDSTLDMRVYHLEKRSEPFDIAPLVDRWVSMAQSAQIHATD